MDNKKLIFIIAIVMIFLAGGIGFWYWSKSKQALKEAPTLGSEIFNKTQNQLQDRVPDINPFKDRKNPFDAIYKNPFE